MFVFCVSFVFVFCVCVLCLLQQLSHNEANQRYEMYCFDNEDEHSNAADIGTNHEQRPIKSQN